ncbi:isochorismatase [Tumebacillus algifaecis]|uniref:isochorismatase n=1 Tax=Tumebacillus algifaecis TaxID=1214604 RepID=A0A223D388_9BACL|nr:isochorismatase family protein [Tumebacillus algifaecis]ASS75854.1 isochorismatase [Tumebacillus algifaecis]
MALPTILPYKMPTASDLPRNKVTWTPDPKRAVLLIHDMQQYFINAFTAGESPIVDLIANIQALKSHCVALGIPVIYTAQPGGQTTEQRGLQLDFWGPGLKDVPDQKQIVADLAPSENDLQLTKWRYSGFQKTNLREILHEQGRDQMIICGVYAHIGCLLTACDAFMQEVEAFYVADAVADFSLDHHKMALTYVAERCGVTMLTEDLMESLNQSNLLESGAPSATGKNDQLLTPALVREQVAELLQTSSADLGEDEDLINSRGLDSIRIMSLVERWRRSGVEVSFVELAEQPTLAKWYELLGAKA